MLDLLLMRHAKSSWDDPQLEDYDRPLAPRGQKAAPLIARNIQERGLLPDLILCSTATRAQETCGLLTSNWPRDIEVQSLRDLYMAEPMEILDHIRETDHAIRKLMVIGHCPGMHELALLLTDSFFHPKRDKLVENLPTAAVVHISLECNEWCSIERGMMVDFMEPRKLAA